uniref:C2H2-type domain-containing protein n=1 Tax=Hippocampus comes TaxID=109280 RepID=A0A3Q2YH98_HIPCM
IGKPFVCPFCCKTFNQRVHLSRHLSVHTGDKPFHCTICSKMFATRDRLRSHTRIHTGEKPFSCPVCGKRFFHRSHLVKHSHIHTGVKPFSCLKFLVYIPPMRFIVSIPLYCNSGLIAIVFFFFK